MGRERGEIINMASELGRLIRTGDYDYFLESLNYFRTMKELDDRVKTYMESPEGREQFERFKKEITRP